MRGNLAVLANRQQVHEVVGLSPRVRGNRYPLYRSMTSQGSIPARAGEPRRQPDRRKGVIPARAGEPPSHRLLVVGVYPRACGGTRYSADIAPHDDKGLSPRVRGNRAMRPVSRYPPSTGLSPRVRGNRVGGHGQHQECGSIPARAGGTAGLHPIPTRYSGLSPRVRGNQTHPLSDDSYGHRCGVYPRACGGTSHRTLRATVEWINLVYPRACGGTRPNLHAVTPVTIPAREPGCPNPMAVGLSPRVRGNLIPAQIYAFAEGSIPARAGEPVLPGTFSNRPP